MNNKRITHVAIHKYRHTCLEAGIQCHGWLAQVLPCGLDSGNPCRNDEVEYNNMPLTTDKHLSSNNALLHSTPPYQSGAVLIISLIMLLLLTLIGVTGSQVTGLEEKMAGNMRQRNLAFQAAEAALRDAEQFIQGTDAAFNPLKLSGGPFQGANCASGLCPTPTTTSVSFNWTGNGRLYSGTISSQLVRQPRYVIELISTDPSTDSSRIYATFRITAFAWGGDANAVVQLQTKYKLHANSFAY